MMKNFALLTLKFASLISLLILIQNVECGAWPQNSRQRGGAARPRARTCSNPKIVNGGVMPMFKGKMIKFSCNKDYQRYGDEYAECMNGRWSIRTFPICIKAGCPSIHPEPDNGKIIYLNAKASALMFCEPNFESVGSIQSHCNGTHWDRQLGSCRETDNSPMTFCDFESESLCEWQHDSDHDTDFERHSGYNNKTISIHTGPQADHTTGVPLQGHYMVMYTNSEVSSKRARLLSPLYNFPTAQQLCFRFYYFMHGTGVGTLRAYVKPESIEMQNVLVDDMEIEAKSEFIIFQIHGQQGNAWIEGGGPIKVPNESFQIIIEAVSGQTRFSDIAFDDFALLTDDECSESDENDTKSPPVTDLADDDVQSSVDSCVGRCFEDVNMNVLNRSLSCSCSLSCHLRVTCCADFLDVCANATTLATTTTVRASTVSTSRPSTVSSSRTRRITSTTSTTMRPTTTRQTTSSTTTTTTPALTTSAAPITTTSTSMRTAPPTTTTTSTSTSSARPTTKTIQTTKAHQDDYEEIEDEHEVLSPDSPESVTGPSPDFHETDKMTMLNNAINFPLQLTLCVLAMCLTIFMISIFIFRRYRESSNPLNYKERDEKHFRGSTNANGEFSEIRYLTSDETLDFTLASDNEL